MVRQQVNVRYFRIDTEELHSSSYASQEEIWGFIPNRRISPSAFA